MSGKMLIKVTSVVLTFIVLFSVHAQQPPPKEKPSSGGKTPKTTKKPVKQRPQKSLDIVFVLDDSGSMKYTDAEEFRKLAVKAFLDLTQDRGGDRIAVVRFAGWQETIDEGFLLVPFTEIPEDEKERMKVLNSMKKTITEKITASGTTTDFNFAFGVALKEVLEKRGKTERPLWVILFTDGDMYVRKEPGRELPDIYKKELGKLPPYPKTLRKLAIGIFGKKILSEVAKIPNLYMTCIKLKGKKEEKKSIVLDLIVQKLKAKMLEGSRENLKAVFLEALGSLPKGLYRPGITKGYGYVKETLKTGESKEFTLHVFQGSVSTKVVLFANDSRFSATVLNKGGQTVYPSEGKTIPGEGDEYRVLDLKDLPWGDYRLLIKNEADREISVEKIIYTEFAITLSLLKEELSPVDAGDTFFLSFQLKDARDGSTIVDRVLFEVTDLFVKVGDKESPPQNFAQLTTGETADTARMEVVSEITSVGGMVGVSAYAAMMPDTLFGGYAFKTEEVKAGVEIVAPVIRVEAPSEVLRSQQTRLKAEILKGRLDDVQKKQGIRLLLYDEKSKKEVEVLFMPTEGEELSADVYIDETGQFKLKEETFDKGRVENDFSVTVKERELNIFLVDKEGRLLSVEEVKLECEEEEKADFKLAVRYSLAPGEEAVGTPLFSPKRGEDADLLSIGSPVVDGKFKMKEGQTVEVPFSLTGKEGVPEYAGDVVIGVEVKDKPNTRKERRIRIRFILKKKPFPWWLVVIGGTALFIIILLLILASRPKFEAQQLWYGVERRYILRDFGKRSFTGTEEAENSIQILLKGSKKKPISYLRPLSDMPVYVDSEQVKRIKALSHGAQIIIYRSEVEPLNYRFWEREPSVEEYMKPAVLPGEGEEYFLIVEEE